MERLSILVFGTTSSGKTTLIHTLRNNSIWVEHIAYGDIVPGFDVGEISINNNLSLFLYGTHGALPVYLDEKIILNDKNFVGGLLMMDSAKPEVFREARAYIGVARTQNHLPYIVLANKQERADAYSVEKLREELQLKPKEIILPLVATDKNSVKQAIRTLIDLLPPSDALNSIKAYLAQP